MNQTSSKSRNSGRQRRRRRGSGQDGAQASGQPKSCEPQLPEAPKLEPRKYAVAFFDSFAAAKENLAELKRQANEVDQLNIVVQADGDMDDPELCEVGKVFAGEAWTLIHRRRQQDGWYDELQCP